MLTVIHRVKHSCIPIIDWATKSELLQKAKAPVLTKWIILKS